MPPKQRGKISKTKVSAKITTDDLDYGADDQDTKLNEIEDEEIPELAVGMDRFEYKPILINEIIYVLPEDRVTSEVMTIFEYTEAISIRAKQIEDGGICFTDTSKLSDPLEMAKKELLDKKSPLDLVRGITNIIYEKWHVNEMTLPPDF